MTSNEPHSKDVTLILSALKDIAEAVIQAAEAGTLKQVLQQIAHVAQQLVNARYAALGIPGEHQTMLFFEVVGITEAEIRQIPHPPLGRGLLGVIMNEREILRLAHMRDDPRSSGFPAHHPPMESLLGVPVQDGRQLYGMLYVTDRLDDRPFTEEDQWLLESLAGYAALAIAGKYLSDHRNRLTLLEERERVGMELHDGIIQSLYAIGMQVQLLRLTQPTLEQELGGTTRNLDVVIEDIRRYILNLKLANYEQKSMRDGLQDVLERLYIPESLTIEVDAPDRQPPFAPPVVEAMCQIAHEAVSNIVRHADASEARIEVTESTRYVQMVIHDNGKGFDSAIPMEHEGLGLHNIVQRARIYGGKVIIDSTPGDGTSLILRMPK